MMSAQPALFLSHGAGPAWLLDGRDLGPGLRDADKHSPSARFLPSLRETLEASSPRAVIVVSAHWEEADFTVNSRPQHSLLYDYGGFPEEAYNLSWAPKGSPELASRVRAALEEGGLTCKEETARGLDHGVFVPLMLVWPQPELPVVEVSLRATMDMTEHIRMGELLAPFRRDGVLVICSGFSTHRSTAHGSTPKWATDFRSHLHDVVASDVYSCEERRRRMLAVTSHESYRTAHPTEDHFMPLPVAMAAGGFSAGDVIHDEFMMGSLLCSHFLFK